MLGSAFYTLDSDDSEEMLYVSFQKLCLFLIEFSVFESTLPCSRPLNEWTSKMDKQMLLTQFAFGINSCLITIYELLSIQLEFFSKRMDGLNRQEHLDSWSPTPPDRFQDYPTVDTWFISFPYRPLRFSFVFSNRCLYFILCMSRFTFDSTQSFHVWIVGLSSTVSV